MNERQKEHSLSLSNRSALAITGVSELISFDEDSVVMQLADSELCVSGVGLSLTKLSLETGEIDVAGRIDSVVYTVDEPRGRSLASRLFGRQ